MPRICQIVPWFHRGSLDGVGSTNSPSIPIPPTPDTMIRFFCEVSPGVAGAVAFAYLEALSNVGRAIRAQPIGMASFEPPWRQATRLFLTPMSAPFVNIVCARPGLDLGQRFALKVLKRLGNKQDLPDVVYQPNTALVGYYTVGCVNIAITGVRPPPSPEEVSALAKYDAVICPTEEDTVELRRLLSQQHQRHARVVHVDPHPDLLGALLDDLCGATCGSVTTATTPPSRASAARPATTPPPLPPQAMRSRSSTGDRSPAIPTPAVPVPSLPSHGIATSSDSSDPGPDPGTLRRMWSWLTGNRSS